MTFPKLSQIQSIIWVYSVKRAQGTPMSRRFSDKRGGGALWITLRESLNWGSTAVLYPMLAHVDLQTPPPVRPATVTFFPFFFQKTREQALFAPPLFTQNKHYENSSVNPTYAGCELSFTPGLSSLLLVTSVRFPLFLWVRHHHMAWCWFVTRSHDGQVIPVWQSLVTDWQHQYRIVTGPPGGPTGPRWPGMAALPGGWSNSKLVR